MSDDDELLARLHDALDHGLPDATDDGAAAFRSQVDAARVELGRQPVAAPIEPGRRALPTWLKVAAASALVVGALAFAFRITRSDDFGEVSGNIEYDGSLTDSAGGVGGSVTVTEIGIGRVVELHTDTLPILPTGEYYEVWFVGTGDAPQAPNRISAGTFHPDPEGRSDVRFAAAVNPALYPFIEITAEPGDGNPAPSAHVVLHAEIPTT